MKGISHRCWVGARLLPALTKAFPTMVRKRNAHPPTLWTDLLWAWLKERFADGNKWHRGRGPHLRTNLWWAGLQGRIPYGYMWLGR